MGNTFININNLFKKIYYNIQLSEFDMFSEKISLISLPFLILYKQYYKTVFLLFYVRTINYLLL